MFITRLKLHNFRNFRDIDIELQRRVFIVGANATGKSNLLGSLLFLRSIANSDGLQRAGRRYSPLTNLRFSNIHSLTAPADDNQISIHVDIAEDAGEPPTWSYTLVLRENASLPHSSSPAVVVGERVTHAGNLVLDRPDQDDKQDPRRLTQTALEQVNANSKFRPLADFLASIDYSNPSPALLRMSSTPPPGEMPGYSLAERIMATPQDVREVRLRQIVETLQTLVPHFAELRAGIDEPIGFPYLQARFNHWRNPDAWQNESDLSDGTLRLIALLWAAQEEGRGPLLLEEPEISLHESVVRLLAEAFAQISWYRRRQVFVTTQSPSLLDDDTISLREILLLQPSDDGTTVSLAAADQQICALIDGGHPRGDAVVPWVGAHRPRLKLHQ